MKYSSINGYGSVGFGNNNSTNTLFKLNIYGSGFSENILDYIFNP